MGGLEGVWGVRLAGVDRAKVANEPRVKRVERMCMVEEKGWFGMWNWFFIVSLRLEKPPSYIPTLPPPTAQLFAKSHELIVTSSQRVNVRSVSWRLRGRSRILDPIAASASVKLAQMG